MFSGEATEAMVQVAVAKKGKKQIQVSVAGSSEGKAQNVSEPCQIHSGSCLKNSGKSYSHVKNCQSIMGGERT